uniref:receptor protein-tyrosine kinase n=1 Tax=Sinocyclocheilus anshuiensis TaxID=1608454 RepID=A0A671LYU3_9TELE
MAKTSHVLSLVDILFTINLVIAIELRFVPDPPTLNITEKTLKINASDTLEITCRGRQILEWSTPHNRTCSETWLTTTDCSGNGLFCSTLTLSKAVANETGEYRCFYKNLPIEDGKTSISVYVFIQDYRTPFVRMAQDYDVVFIREGEQVVIPCLVSVENLDVTLYTKYPVKELATDGKEVIWDSKRGFILPSHVVSYAGVVYCQTTIRNETYQSSPYIVAVVGYKIYDLTLSPPHERLTVGERLMLNCTAHTELNVGIDFQWTFPHEKVSNLFRKLWNSLELSNTLIVENVTVNDTGEYICTASSGQMQKIGRAALIVYEKPFIALNDQMLQTVEATAGQEEAKILVKYYAYPEPSVKWYKNDQLIVWKDEYRMKPNRGSLTIYGVTEKDAGNYTVVMTNKITKEEQRRTFQLLVNGSESLLFSSLLFSSLLFSSLLFSSLLFSSLLFSSLLFSSLLFSSLLFSLLTLKIQKAVDHALYRCIASNKMGIEERVIVFQVARDVLPSSNPTEGEDVVMRCVADRLLYSNLRWYRVTNIANPDASPAAVPCDTLTLSPLHQTNVTISGLQGTNAMLDLPIPNATLMDQGLYACQFAYVQMGYTAEILHKLECTSQISLYVSAALEMSRIVTNLTDQRVNVSDSTTLVCEVSGTPTPTVVWTKDNQTVMEGSGVILKRSNRVLTIQRVKKEDSGLYICTACNQQGCDSHEARITVDGAEEKMNVELIMPIGAVVIAMILWLLIVFVIRNRKRPNEGDLKTGYLSIILDSDDMPMDEHCERLTYDANKWEFPRDRLKLGEPLGRGAFGQVVEASAYGIEKATTCTTVAVKMLKEGATTSEYRALMSELKILIHIGHHLNVVNLLGACTKPGGPLMVIVEYCKHGNLSSYLKSKRGEYSPYKVNSIITYSFNEHYLKTYREFLNILLSENNVVKICDFGLARDVYKDPDYVRKGDARLPLKWMAPETIFDRVYTTQSDVWSFGVLLWEIFSLGASPYPGVCIDESFCRRLKEGTRMRAPDYATPEIYQTMLDCWLDRPKDRPTFTQLVEHLGNLLQASAQQVRLDSKYMFCLIHIDNCGLPISMTTFVDIPLEHTLWIGKRKDHFISGDTFILISAELQTKAVAQSYKHVHAFIRSPLLRCKSKESLASESSNQTSGYQSGYHSDDAEAPIYANEEMILKRDIRMKPPLSEKGGKHKVLPPPSGILGE